LAHDCMPYAVAPSKKRKEKVGVPCTRTVLLLAGWCIDCWPLLSLLFVAVDADATMDPESMPRERFPRRTVVLYELYDKDLYTPTK